MTETSQTGGAAPRPARLLLVVALVLGAVAVPTTLALGRKQDPSYALVHADFAVMSAALEKYRAAHGTLPEEGALDFLVPEYLPELPLDPWGRPYVYLFNGQQVFLATFGEDGLRGGSGTEQDHTIHDGHTP
ncbi:type II secretion system protein GspG [Stigmatella sp. ncwal1]|uniref:Type II secretion system protein GspG n=1 Tax=Stigmatella ashevillensis TaxID=2995309 RepID=A0ABT5DIM3_9BACT|nr:type II secretion system protein GspG [Stigmatella ashevillena]MDC0712172.1 type II secretion system protein GspG [Stigmatella ashevillena]